MLHPRGSRNRGVMAAAFAVLAALICTIPCLVRPPAASAQTPYTCPNGQVVYPSVGQACTSTMTTAGTYTCPNGQVIPIGAMCTNIGSTTCPNGQIVAPGQSCATTLGAGGTLCPYTGQPYYPSLGQTCTPSTISTTGTYTCPNGQVVAAGQVCPATGYTSTGYTTCPNGQQVLAGVSCLTTGATTTSGSCVGISLAAGESCSNGVVTCNGQPVATGTACSSAASVASTTATTLPQAENMTCPGGGYVPVGQACPTITVSTSSTTTTAATTPVAASTEATTATTPPAGFSVTYPAGWDIVAGPTGTTLPGVAGSLYTLQPGDTSYEMIPAGTPLKAGEGYWADVGSSTPTTIALASSGSMTVSLPPGQFVMIGNPGDTVATVTGADTVLVYSPSTNNYTSATQLQPGQGAWAYSAAGGQATIMNAPAGQS